MKSVRFAMIGLFLLVWAVPAAALQCVVLLRESVMTAVTGPILGSPWAGQWLVGMDGEGLFRYADGQLTQVAGGSHRDVSYIGSISQPSNGSWIVETRRGMFQYSAGRLTRIPVNLDVGDEAGIPGSVPVPLLSAPVDGIWLLSSQEGLFQIRAGRLSRIAGPTGRVRVLGAVEDGWLITDATGLLRYSGGRLTAVTGGSVDEAGPAANLDGPLSSGWLVGTSRGLFFYHNGRLTPLEGGMAPDIGEFFYVSRPLGGMWLVVAGGRLFTYSSARSALVPISGISPARVFNPISAPVGGGWLIVTSQGQLVRFDGAAMPVPGAERITVGSVVGFSPPIGDALLVESYGNLFRYAGGRLTPVPRGALGPPSGNTERYTVVGDRRRGWLINDSNGLFYYDGRGVERVLGTGAGGSGGVSQVSAGDGGVRLVAGVNGLFRYVGQPALVARLRPGQSIRLTPGQPSYVAWDVSGDCSEHARNDSFRVSTGDGPPPAEIGYDRDRRIVTLMFSPETIPVARTIRLYVVGAGGEARPISDPVDLDGPIDWTALAERAGLAASILHTFFFVSLIVAARWSDRAAAMLLHPVSRKVGLWFGWALRYFPFVQQWLLRRWFDARRAKLLAHPTQPVLPVPVTDRATDPSFLSTELAARLHPRCRIWLAGKPGMGKSVIARDIEARFFRDSTSLGEAIRKRGHIPLFVRLRDFAGADFGKGDANWPARVAEAVLGGQGFILDEVTEGANLSFVAAILKRSRFVLLLDGANEVPWDAEIVAAAAATEQPGLFVTSQMTPADAASKFALYSLPATITEAVEPLLKLFLDEEGGARLYAAIADSPLIDEIKSGYDLRLLESLYKAGHADIPRSRIALYDAIISRVFASGRVEGPVDRLYQFAWSKWLERTRQFSSEGLDPSLREALQDTDMPVVRTLDGDKMEFRHEQLHGYLAARHVLAAANPVGLLERSESEWPQSRADQDWVWNFLGEIVDDDAAGRIYRWTLEKPDDRIALQAALRGRVPDRVRP